MGKEKECVKILEKGNNYLLVLLLYIIIIVHLIKPSITVNGKHVPGNCANCKREGENFKVCSRCKMAQYCSVECLRANWYFFRFVFLLLYYLILVLILFYFFYK